MTALLEQQEETCSYLQGPCGSHKNLYLCMQVSRLWLRHWAVILQSSRSNSVSLQPRVWASSHISSDDEQSCSRTRNAQSCRCVLSLKANRVLTLPPTPVAELAWQQKLENSRVSSFSPFQLSLSLHISLTDIVKRLQSLSFPAPPTPPSHSLSVRSCTFQWGKRWCLFSLVFPSYCCWD